MQLALLTSHSKFGIWAIFSFSRAATGQAVEVGVLLELVSASFVALTGIGILHRGRRTLPYEITCWSWRLVKGNQPERVRDVSPT